MARKDDTLTPRQKQSQRIMREKAQALRRKERTHQLRVAAMTSVGLALMTTGLWIWQTNALERATQAVAENTLRATADAGFSLQHLYLEGRSRTSMDEILQALQVREGAPILGASLEAMRERLEAIPSVKQAAVERSLPGALHVRIVEREPVAIWQHKGKQVLVDDNGVVIDGVAVSSYPQLPLIVGPDAPKHVLEVVTLLAAQPALATQFSAAVRVGERRWNIRLKDGKEVRLPERGVLEAWNQLAELDQKEQLLRRQVQVIDLRVSGRLFIKLSPENTPAANAAGATET